MKTLRVKFFCRSFNKELYLLSRRLYEEAGYPCVRLTDQTADGYFFRMLEDETCDIAINVDEDCFLTDLDAVLALAKKVADEGWVNAGCSDAGEGCPRSGDAVVTNPFFNVFNLRLIRKAWNAYRLIPELRKDSYKGLEPYYNFFHWMVRTFPGKTLYLDNRKHSDGVTTMLYDAASLSTPLPCGGAGERLSGEGLSGEAPRLLCQHTWFARQFSPSFLTRLFEGNDLKGVNHQQRINAVIDESYQIASQLHPVRRPEFNALQRLDFRLDACQRWCVKIPQRIANWPNKLRRRFSGR